MKKTMLFALAVFTCLVSHAQFYVPYGMQPNVAVENAYNQIQSNMQEQYKHYWDNVNPNSMSTTPAPSSAPSSSYNNKTSNKRTNTTSNRRNSSTPRTSQHDRCNGTGKCNTCNGSGQMWVGNSKKRCVNCNGTGRCSGCNGTGRTSAHYY